MSKHLPILTYHSLDDSGSVISTAPAQFARQMELLHARGWRTLRLQELMDGYARGQWPERALMLTFDDGFANFAQHALPILQRFGFSALLFVVPHWVGHSNDWPSQPRWAPRLPLLGWDELRAAVAAGTEIGAHTLAHPYLSQLSNLDAAREIYESKRALELKLRCAVEAFAYPYGDRTPLLEQMVAADFRAGFSTRLACASASSPRAAFERIDVYRLRSLRLFGLLGTNSFGAYLRLSRGLVALRAASQRVGLTARAKETTPGLRSAMR